MDLIHITVTFEDTFSGAKIVRHVTRSVETFGRMKQNIGKIVVDRFNKVSQIHETLRLISVEQSVPNIV